MQCITPAVVWSLVQLCAQSLSLNFAPCPSLSAVQGWRSVDSAGVRLID